MQLKLGPFTTILVAINVLVAICMTLPNMAKIIQVAGGFMPSRLFGGANIPASLAMVPAIFTPFTAPFIHNGMLDMLFPSLMLLLMGSMNEKILGWLGVSALFFCGAIASAIVVTVLLPSSTMIYYGSHNAVSSVIAAYLLLYPIGKLLPWGPLKAAQARPLQLVVLWSIVSLVTGQPFSYEGFVSTVIAPVIAFAIGLLLARPLLLLKYRHA